MRKYDNLHSKKANLTACCVLLFMTDWVPEVAQFQLVQSSMHG